jgi:hypothetical protein
VLEEIAVENPKVIEFFNIIIQLLNSEDFSVLEDHILKKWSNVDKSKYPTSDGEREVGKQYHEKFVEKLRKFLDQL